MSIEGDEESYLLAKTPKKPDDKKSEKADRFEAQSW